MKYTHPTNYTGVSTNQPINQEDSTPHTSPHIPHILLTTMDNEPVNFDDVHNQLRDLHCESSQRQHTRSKCPFMCMGNLGTEWIYQNDQRSLYHGEFLAGFYSRSKGDRLNMPGPKTTTYLDYASVKRGMLFMPKHLSKTGRCTINTNHTTHMLFRR